ncbi:MAG: hypothetical protein AMXMBFR58_33890 [Phycisphaerae bacterium]|nr:hypothetical protein [Phycisphaerales bacterium]MCK6477738.1 hypothetical protein [Phycisphaerales bacterium]
MDPSAHLRPVDAITRRLDSVTQLDVLLLLHGSQQREWSPQEVATELRIGAQWAEQYLRVLCARGLIVSEQAGYRYVARPDLEQPMQELTRLYRTHPVGIIAAIYRPNKQLEEFADAFRIRRPTSGDDKGPSHG